MKKLALSEACLIILIVLSSVIIAVGTAGFMGHTVTTGPQGAIGPKGDTGSTGPQGAKGDRGNRATGHRLKGEQEQRVQLEQLA